MLLESQCTSKTTLCAHTRIWGNISRHNGCDSEVMRTRRTQYVVPDSIRMTSMSKTNRGVARAPFKVRRCCLRMLYEVRTGFSLHPHEGTYQALYASNSVEKMLSIDADTQIARSKLERGYKHRGALQSTSSMSTEITPETGRECRSYQHLRVPPGPCTMTH